MLFAVKNRYWLSLALLACFIVLTFSVGLSRPLQFDPFPVTSLAAAMAVFALSDGLGHGVILLIFGDRYRRCYRALVEYFQPQRVMEIVCGGLLAGGEELVFRGILLEELRSLAGWPAPAAIAISALAFGLCHLIPRKELWPFAIWAVWEGALLGGAYVVTNSLAVCVVLHALHDAVGFSLFALQRRTGWML